MTGPGTPPAVRDPRAEAVAIEARPDLTAGRRVGVLLSHGFTGSPASIRPWATALGERGYGVVVPRLPGHGTTWQDMATTSWDDWYAELDRALSALVATHDTVVVGGLSMGGALALRLAAERPADVAGLLLVNPAVTSRDRRLVAVPLLKRLVATQPGIVDDIRLEGQDEVGYAKVPLAALDTMLRGWRALRPELPRVTAPLLVFRSVVDHVVDPSSAALVTAAVSSDEVTEQLLTRSWHVATLDHDAPVIAAASADFVARVARLADVV
ncbi:carboxylesterase [Nocardioides sp. CFH 31398]|uniref:alpha/beta hydrolase n=1 Tax=Nocardioides sp. CFH 31398 TaxID=2919579 RepID=UPI001F054716|nr:alpha/beta fold hydrolase [Nocardioides sp. CFH 31398]MCH1868234.1 alpha/beta fold hydrolase [Nocardioides sp. CFH 31398]